MSNLRVAENVHISESLVCQSTNTYINSQHGMLERKMYQQKPVIKGGFSEDVSSGSH